MKFTIEVNKNHFYDFNKYTMKKINGHDSIKPKAKIVGFLYWFLLAFSAINILNVYDINFDHKNLNFAVGSFVVWFVLVNIWHRIYIWLFSRAAVSENGMTIGTHEIEILEQGFKSTKPHSNYFIGWEAIKCVETHKNQLYLYIDNAHAFIVPLDQVNESIKSKIMNYLKNTNKDK